MISLDRVSLHKLLSEYFSLEELRTICFYLYVDWDNLPGPEKSSKARELILHLERRGGDAVQDLIMVCKRERPKVDWPAQYLEPSLDKSSPFWVPYYLNSRLIGRSGFLEEIKETFERASIVSLTGMGGIGKSRLATEYAHWSRREKTYSDGIFWVDATKPLAQGLVEILDHLPQQSIPTTLSGKLNALFEYFQNNPKVLIILDNLSDLTVFRSPIEEHFHLASLPCSILVTSRISPGSVHDVRFIEIPILSDDTATELLLYYASRRAQPDESEYQVAKVICRMLGGLPLAIEMAGAYLAVWHDEVTLVGYQKWLEKDGRLPVLNIGLEEIPAYSLPAIHQAALDVTLESQWHMLQNESARLILQIAGQFPFTSTIPSLQLGLLAGLPIESDVGRPSPLQQALRRLRVASLIKPLQGEEVGLHPLIHEFAARLIPEQETETFRTTLLTNLRHSLNDSQPHYGRAIAAGECLLNPPWPMPGVRLVVLQALRQVVSTPGIPVPKRRKAALLLAQLHWLEAFPDVSPAEMLTFLNSIIRFVGSTVDRRLLIEQIDGRFLPSSLLERQRIQFLIFKAQLYGQLYEFLREAVKRSKEGHELVNEARRSIKQAKTALLQLIGGGLEDQWLKAQVCFYEANIVGLKAESSRNPATPMKMAPITLKLYSEAANAAIAHGQDILLIGGIYGELGYNYGTLGQWDEFEACIQKALALLGESIERLKDPESYADRRAHVLTSAGYAHWIKGQQVASQNKENAYKEYEAAQRLTEEAILLLQKFVKRPRNLVVAYLNVGDYLLERHLLLIDEEKDLLRDSCLYWQKAAELARRQGNLNLLQMAKGQLEQYCS